MVEVKKIKGDYCTFKRSKSINKTCCSHCFEYSIFEEKVLDSIAKVKSIDKDTITRKQIQKIIDAIFIDKNRNITIIFIDKNRNITIIFKDKKVHAIDINYNDIKIWSNSFYCSLMLYR